MEFDGEGTAIGGGFGGTEPGEGGFEAVYGVAVDNSAGACKGDVYVANEGRHLERFLPGAGAGEYTFAAGLEAENNAESVAVDSHGNLYAGLYPSEDGLSEFACEGTSPTRIDQGSSATKSVEGVAVDVAGDVYVVNEKHNVVKFNSSEVKEADGELEAEGEAPVAIAVDQENGEVFVLDSEKEGVSEYHVTRYDATGKKLESFGEGEIGSSPEGGIAYSPKYGEVYVTDQTKEEVHIYKEAGVEPVASFGVSGPYGVAVEAVTGSVCGGSWC